MAACLPEDDAGIRDEIGNAGGQNVQIPLEGPVEQIS